MNQYSKKSHIQVVGDFQAAVVDIKAAVLDIQALVDSQIPYEDCMQVGLPVSVDKI